jgi:YVTN family beta-propeller protein
MKAKMNATACLFVLGVLASSILYAENTPRETLLVLSKSDQTLAIVDPATLKVVARVPVGNDPHEVIASTDGKLAYVSNYGFGAYHTLAVVDLITQKARAAIDLGPLLGPHGLTYEGGKTWFTAEGAKAIGRYDPVKKKVDWILGTGQNRTHMIFVSKDLKHIFTTNVSSGTVSIIEKSNRKGPDFGPPPGAGPGGPPPGGPPPGMAHGPGNHHGPMGVPGGDWNETVVPVGRGGEGFDVTPGGKQIWVANAQDGTVSIIDVASKRVIDTLPPNFRGANRLKFTPDGKLVFISASGLDILDAATHKEIKSLDAGCGGGGIQMEPDGSRAYAACNREGYVAAIDLKTLKVIGRINAGGDPDGMAWATRQ